MSKSILAGALALFLGAGLAGTARADAAGSTAPDPSVIQLFGRTFCLAGAPADARCDWRLAPAEQPSDADGELTFTLLGTRYCLTPEVTVCPAAPAEERAFRLFGFTWCKGAAGPGCDVVIPDPATDATASPAMHASR